MLHSNKLINLLLLVLLINCGFSNSYSNRESDRKDAEKVTQTLYKYIILNDVNTAFNLFHNFRIKESGYDAIIESIIKPREKLGVVQKYSLIEWKTQIYPEDPRRSRYKLVYKVKRKRNNTIETISLAIEKEKIKIINYNIVEE